jgi:hypothetical protein
MEILVRPVHEDLLARRHGRLGKSGREGKATFASRRWSVLLEVWCIMVSFVFSLEEFANSLFFGFLGGPIVILDGAELETGLRT